MSSPRLAGRSEEWRLEHLRPDYDSDPGEEPRTPPHSGLPLHVPVCAATSTPPAGAPTLQRRDITALRTFLFQLIDRVRTRDLRPLVAQLRPPLPLNPALCTDRHCTINRRWLRKVRRRIEAIDESSFLLSTAALLLKISNEFERCHFVMNRMYTMLAEKGLGLASLLSRSVTVAEELEEKLNLELLRYILLHAPRYCFTPQNICTSYKDIIRTLKGAHPWDQRQFLHAVLLSMGSPRDQQEAFQRLRGHEILLPVHIYSAWPRALQKMHDLLLNHSPVNRIWLKCVIWFGPCQVHSFLKNLSSSGFPHIAQELQRHLHGKNAVTFVDKGGVHKTVNEQCASSAGAPDDFTIHFRPHLQHPLEGDNVSSGEHSLDSWIFCMSGALASQWTEVCEFLQVKEEQMKRVKEDPWYNNKHRLFNVLKSLQEERTLSPGQLTCMLLSYCETSNCNAHAQRVIRAALPYVAAEYCTLKRSYSKFYPFYVKQSNKLLAVSSKPTVALEEITGAEFEPFLTSYAIVGPPFNVCGKPGDKVLVFLPSDVSLEMHWSQSHLSKCLESLSSLIHCDSLSLVYAQLSDLLNVDEQERLLRYFLIGMFDELAELILQNGSHCIQSLGRFLGTAGAQIRLWPHMYCSMIEASSMFIGHLTVGNLAVLVPLAYTRNWAVILLDCFSPLALLKKLIKPNQIGAMFLLYKPVGRRYREQKIKLLKVFLVPQKESLARELDDRQTGYKQICRKRMVLEKKSHYRLKATDQCLKITPETKKFQPVQSAEEMLTEFTVQLCKEFSRDLLLVLQLLKANETKIIVEEQIDEEILKMEDDYIIIIHDSMETPLCVLIDNSGESILEEIENQYPRERYMIYHTIDAAQIQISGKSSLQYVLQKRPYGDCRLEAKGKLSSTATSPALSPSVSCAPSSASLLVLSPAPPHAPSSPPSTVNFPERLPSSVTFTNNTAKIFLEDNRANLVEKICEIDSTLDQLLEVGVISQEEYEIIRSNHLIREKVRATVDSVIRKGPDAMGMFCQILARKQEFVMKDLMKNL